MSAVWQIQCCLWPPSSLILHANSSWPCVKTVGLWWELDVWIFGAPECKLWHSVGIWHVCLVSQEDSLWRKNRMQEHSLYFWFLDNCLLILKERSWREYQMPSLPHSASSWCLKSNFVVMVKIVWTFQKLCFRNNQDPSLIISPFFCVCVWRKSGFTLSRTGPEKKPAISAVCVSLIHSCSARNLLIRPSKTNTVIVMCVFTESCLQTAVSQWSAMK